jgi:hypothetical protein
VSSLIDLRPLSDEARFRIAETIPTRRVVKVVDLDRVTERTVDEIAPADLVVMLTRAGADAHAAAVVGDSCSSRRIPTATVVVAGSDASDDALSKTLAQVRPWSLMVVVTSDAGYVDDILTSFR